MANADITTNAVEVYDSFYKLTIKEMRKAIRRGINKASAIVRKNARASLKARIGKAATRKSRYGDSLSQSIRLTKIKEEKGEIFRYLLITSPKNRKSIGFVLKFFEGGTVQRRTSKGYNRGVMQATNFFSTAVESSRESYEQTLTNEINNCVDKINSSK